MRARVLSNDYDVDGLTTVAYVETKSSDDDRGEEGKDGNQCCYMRCNMSWTACDELRGSSREFFV